MDQPITFTVAEVFMNPWEAHIARALLESEGIPAYLGSENIVAVWWPMSSVFGGVRLLVRHEHHEQAKAVLALRDRGELEAALVESYPPEVMRCVRCKSEQFEERRSWPATALAFILLSFGSAIFPPARDLRCVSCGEVKVCAPTCQLLHIQ